MTYIVALTGTIGSGKTTVANLFGELGIEIIDADIIARELTTTNKNIITAITDYFGKEIPWYTKEYAKEYVEANDYEKSVLTVYNLYIRIFSMYNQLSESEREKMIFIFFEDFATNPDTCINKICKILDTERCDNFETIMQNLSIPRSLEKCNFISVDELIEEYRQFLSEDIIFKLRELNVSFSNFHKQVK